MRTGTKAMVVNVNYNFFRLHVYIFDNFDTPYIQCLTLPSFIKQCPIG